MRVFLWALVLLVVAAARPARAQDEQQLTSPNGQFVFHLYVIAEPAGGLWPRIGYDVTWRGKPLIRTSLLGMDLLNQEPFLGENPGFMSATSSAADAAHPYNSLLAHYMQNGSLGRRLDIEVRAYDDAIAFRYIIPKSTPVEELLIRDEATEFNLTAVKGLPAKPDYDVPLVLEESGAGWVEIAEAVPKIEGQKYPRVFLVRSGSGGLATNLARSAKDPVVAFSGTTPIVWPWRVILAAADRDALAKSDSLRDLH